MTSKWKAESVQYWATVEQEFFDWKLKCCKEKARLNRPPILGITWQDKVEILKEAAKLRKKRNKK